VDVALMSELKKQIAKHYSHRTWEELMEESLQRSKRLFTSSLKIEPLNALWKNPPADGNKFRVLNMIVVPFDVKAEDEVIASINLRQIKHVEHDQGEADVYEKVKDTAPAYFVVMDGEGHPTMFAL
jgi:hypothetical protein